MNNRYRKKKFKILFKNILKLVSIILVLSILTFNVAKYLNEKKQNNLSIIHIIDTETFKNALNHSWPLIDRVYNSGSIDISFGNEVRGIIKKIFGFDLRKPITIINTQSAIFHTYYTYNYLPYIDESEIQESEEYYKLDYHNLAQNDSTGPSSSINSEDENNNQYDENGSGNSSDDNSDNQQNDKAISFINETEYEIDVEKLLYEPLNLNFDKKGPKVLIYHTHTTEAYINNISDLNKKNVSTNTEDPRYNVVRVGEEIKKYLENNYKIDVIHNGTIHDSPDYNSSYNNAYKTVTSILKSYPSIEIVLDIHRDATDGKKLRLVTDTNEGKAAQVMSVVSTGAIGLSHPNWRENLKLALKIQQSLNSQCPNLARPIYVSKYRYNQHVSKGAIIIEVGGNGNTLEEALASAKYIAKAINDVINSK